MAGARWRRAAEGALDAYRHAAVGARGLRLRRVVPPPAPYALSTASAAGLPQEAAEVGSQGGEGPEGRRQVRRVRGAGDYKYSVP